MSETTISLAEAKTRLSELAERVLAGESVVITRRGKAIVRLTSLGSERKPINPDELRALTRRQPAAPTDSPTSLRTLRDDARY